MSLSTGPRSWLAGLLARHQSDAARGRCNPSPLRGQQFPDDRRQASHAGLQFDDLAPHSSWRTTGSWDRGKRLAHGCPTTRLAMWHTGSPLALGFSLARRSEAHIQRNFSSTSPGPTLLASASPKHSEVCGGGEGKLHSIIYHILRIRNRYVISGISNPIQSNPMQLNCIDVM